MNKAILIALTLSAGVIAGVSLQPYLPATQRIQVAQLPDSAVYTGALREGLFAGEGKMRWPNGQQYQGGFERGLFSGQGQLRYPDGDSYKGEFRNGLPHGFGEFTFSSGGSYKGTVVDGLLHGDGSLHTAREQYTGGFARDYYDGSGSVKYSNGDNYTGSFKQGEFDGQGHYSDADGNVFTGQFSVGELSGEGSWSGSNGDKYIGQFRNWKFHGRGLYTAASGDTYEGDFVDNQFSGTGKKILADGARYEGEFNDWTYSGDGTATDSDGNQYRGEFRGGYFHGDGTYRYASTEDGIEKFTGRWRWGTLIEAQYPRLLSGVETKIETALYAQEQLLQQQFAALAQSTPNIELFVLAVAGDGTQSVFLREVEYLKGMAATQFAAAERTVILANSKNKLAEYPLVTATSMQRALATLAQRMGPEDILFIYLTSHGSEDHQFSVKQKGILLPDVPAQTLATLLEEAAIQWKVVVVSACYSGGFLPLLANDNTLVMSAAASDKTSFGCADDAEFTYFGRALLEQSLNQGESFVQAFANAETLVAKWEKERDFPQSKPQMASAAPIIKHLEKWRDNLPANTSPANTLLDKTLPNKNLPARNE